MTTASPRQPIYFTRSDTAELPAEKIDRNELRFHHASQVTVLLVAVFTGIAYSVGRTALLSTHATILSADGALMLLLLAAAQLCNGFWRVRLIASLLAGGVFLWPILPDLAVHPVGPPQYFLAVTLLSLGIALYHVRGWLSVLVEGLVLLAATVAWLALGGYLLNAWPYYQIAEGLEFGMARAVLMLALVAAFFLSRPERGLTALLRSDRSDGFAARCLLPVPFLVPYLFSALNLLALTKRLYEPAIGQWLSSLANTAFFALLIWGTAALLRRIDGERQKMSDALTEANRKLECRVEERTHALQTANEALSRTNDDLQQFAYAASHDLQEPLRMVSAYTQLLSRRYGPQLDQRAQSYIGFSVEGARRIEVLLQSLREYWQADKTHEQPVRTSLEEVIAQASANLRTSIEQSGATIQHGRLPEVLAHPVPLTQLFQNLLSNSIKYRSEQPPRITIDVGREGGRWLISVRDNGIGIPADYRQQVFRVFKRLHGRDVPGTGIGLALCQKIVEHYGGRIWVESSDGKGSTFRFTLPAEAE